MTLNHDEAWASLAAAALGALGDEEREAVLAHVEECRQCATELASLRDSAAQMAWLAPREAVNAVRCGHIRDRLMARARADAEIARRESEGGQLRLVRPDDPPDGDGG